jgi:hypothetical protein
MSRDIIMRRMGIETPVAITEDDNAVTIGAEGRYDGSIFANICCAHVELPMPGRPVADADKVFFWKRNGIVPPRKVLFMSGIGLRMTSIIDAEINVYTTAQDGGQYSLTIYPTPQNLVGRALFANNSDQSVEITITLEATVRPEARLIQDGENMGAAILAKAKGGIVFDVRDV